VLGRWRSTASETTLNLGSHEWKVRGGVDTILEYRPNGTFTMNFKITAFTGSESGVKWTYVLRGTATGNVWHADRTEYTTGVNGRGTVYEDGDVNVRLPLTLTSGTSQCVRFGDSLRLVSETDTDEYARIR
jgi:hypothetical protein